MDSPTCLMVHWDMRALRWNSEFAWTVPPVPWYNRIGWTVGYGGSDGTVDSHGQFHCSMGQWDPIGFLLYIADLVITCIFEIVFYLD